MDIKAALKSQYHAALAMLRDAVEKCPEEIWLGEVDGDPFWQVAYHALFYGHLYLMPDEEAFEAWEHHREEHQFLEAVPWPPHDPPKLGKPYTREEILDYWKTVDDLVDPTLSVVDLSSEECGFWWYDLPKLEHELLSIRHVQHHASRLGGYVRLKTGNRVDWVGY
jgi:hypothetical protein